MREYILRRQKVHPRMKDAYALKAELNQGAVKDILNVAGRIGKEGPLTERARQLAVEAAGQLQAALEMK